MAIKHKHTAVPNEVIQSAFYNDDHTAEEDPVFAAWDKDHADLSNVTSDQHHAKQHAITATADHTSTATSGRMLKADANGLPINATNTDANVADAVTKKHSQNTDTALGAGCVAADHGAAATDMVVNVCYGTGAPPDPATMTEGALWIKYTA